MRFAGQVPNFFDRGVDFGSRHTAAAGNQAQEQMKAWGLEGMVHNAGIEAEANVEMAKADAMGMNPGGMANYGGAVGDALSGLGGGLGKYIEHKWG